MFEMLATTAVWLAVVTGIIIIVWAIDDYLFKNTFADTTLGDAFFCVVSVVLPWAFAIYTIAFFVSCIMTSFDLSFTVIINQDKALSF